MQRIYNTPIIVVAYIALLVYGMCDFFAIYFEATNLIKLPTSIVIVWALLRATKNQLYDTSNVLIKVFVVFTVFVLIRGSLLGNFPVSQWHELHDIYSIVREFLVNPFAALSYLVMLFVLVPFDPKEMRYYRPIAYFCTAFCLINCIVFRDQLFSFSNLGLTNIIGRGEELTIRDLIGSTFIGMGAILFFDFGFNTFKRNWKDFLPLIVLLLYLLAQIAGGGRGGTVTALVYVVVMLLFFIHNQKGLGSVSITGQILRISFAIMIVYGIYYLAFKTNAFDFVFSRMFESGRMGSELVESNRIFLTDAFVNDLNEHPVAWLIGKGVNGSFVVPGDGLRANIEWGYMQIILRGGLIHLVLYVWVLLRAAYLGFYKSNNQLSKAMAAMCFLRVYLLIPFGLPCVTLEFLMVWHFVRLINTNSFRKMSDADIKLLINRKI